uniref:Tripartite motif-containing protein 65 n=1 Tax=Amazona collaria TaxID=241587 RepID=A0A8B9G6T9_9PSIT
MATPGSQKLEEKLVCSICLELFRVPVTLPCGHNFCKLCISNHWQKQEQDPAWAESGYTCPECRRGFSQRPELEKNVTLCSVVELARDGVAWALGTERSEVAQSMEKAQEESERTKQVMEELEERTLSIKVTPCKFALLRKALEDCQGQAVAKIEQEQAVALGRMEEEWNLLKDRLDILSQHTERAQQLLACPDNRTFLQVPSSEPHTHRTTEWHKGLMKHFSPFMLLLFTDHRNLTFDPKTANKYLALSKGNRKAKHSPGTICRQEQGPRFEPWQVLCTQGYSHGHHYWEVKFSSHSVVLGVTYRSLPPERKQGHKFNIGLDGGSWGLQVREDCYLAWHKGQPEKIQEQLCRNLGVSLDYDKGLLSFYGLGERTWLIHSFHDVFTEPLYPVFWLCEGRAVELCWRD